MSRRPSPALIVAVAALVAALAGTAVAGPGASTSKITKSKVRTISNKQIDKRLPLTAADIGDAAITGPKLATINVREETANFPAGAFAEATATCQTNERVLSGGIRSNSTFPLVTELHKQSDGWRGRAFNNGTAGTLTVEAYCLAA